MGEFSEGLGAWKGVLEGFGGADSRGTKGAAWALGSGRVIAAALEASQGQGGPQPSFFAFFLRSDFRAGVRGALAGSLQRV